MFKMSAARFVSGVERCSELTMQRLLEYCTENVPTAFDHLPDDPDPRKIDREYFFTVVVAHSGD